MIRRAISTVLLVFGMLPAFAQADSIWSKPPEISFSGYADVFYAWDFNRPEGDSRQHFLYNHNRHNEFNLNLGFIGVKALHPRYHANFTLQAGTYATDNYAAESDGLRHVYEANAGFALNRNRTWWIEGGIFTSHIGFESAVSRDCWTLSRSLMAENSPYYMAGGKLAWRPNERWEVMAMIANGWQRIRRVEGNSLPAFSSQLKYTSERWVANWSAFVGTEFPDDQRRMRYFNNVYVQVKVSEKVGVIAAFDLGIQERSKNTAEYHAWMSQAVVIRYAFSEQYAAAVRGEYYDDPSGVIVFQQGRRLSAVGVSGNVDYRPAEAILCRLEGRWLNNDLPYFVRGDQLVRDNFTVMGSIAVAF